MLELRKFIRAHLNSFRQELSKKPYSIKIMEDEHCIFF